jgi:uncharacterized protein YbaR (Trm112 family)
MSDGSAHRAESGAMRFFRRLGLDGIAWSLRRLHCPVDRQALVLDIGSGGNPYPRANVLLDAYEDTIERFHLPLVRDRPIVYGYAERMPFKDKAFDFIVASHVLEHSQDPEAFLKEIIRVGKAGYIETPDAFFEMINPFRFHRLEVTSIDGRLVIFKKPAWRHHETLVDLYERKLKDRHFIKYIQRHPDPFNMRFYWQGDIKFEIRNPEVDITWAIPDHPNALSADARLRGELRRKAVQGMRRLFSQNNRNKTINLLQLLRCPSCCLEDLQETNAGIHCLSCRMVYPIRHGIPVMYPREAAP